jgi:broad specificity phosphatase PhoE
MHAGHERKRRKLLRCYIIRHGETQSNVHKIYAGTSNERITARAEQEARLLAERLVDRGITFCYVSPIRRAVDTALILAGNLAISAFIEKNLREMELGPWEGLSEDRVAVEFPEEWKTWNQTPAWLGLAGRETLEDVQRRILSVLQTWCLCNKKKTIAAVTHVALIRCILLYSMGKPLNDYRQIHVPNTTAFVLDVELSKPDRKLHLYLDETINTHELSDKALP